MTSGPTVPEMGDEPAATRPVSFIVGSLAEAAKRHFLIEKQTEPGGPFLCKLLCNSLTPPSQHPVLALGVTIATS
jgi:hypothetical protein